MNAVSIGTQPMRSRYDVPHDKVIYYPDLLKKEGYLIANGGKTDYNIGSRDDKECWKGGGKWDKRKPGQPFFQIHNFHKSHESNAFRKDENYKFINDPQKMILHSYHPDLMEIRKDYAKYADSVEKMDENVGEVLDKLKADGLYEDTIIIYCSDHGGVMARSKRFLYSSGIHCPLVIRIPEKWKHLWPKGKKPGMSVDRLVSFVDMPKTWLSLAGAEIPDTYQGAIFLGEGIEPEPKYHVSFRERADEACDMVRGLRDKQYAYIKNYMPWAPNGQQLKFMFVMKGAQAWKKHFMEGKTNDITGRFFKPRVSEEFYDTTVDFDNVNNLIDDPKHSKKINELRNALRATQLKLYDSGLLPEVMRLRRAEENKMTIYEMVRDPKLYPLKKYLDFTDKVLSRDIKNLQFFIKAMSDPDDGIRYWAICGLFLLKKKALPGMDVIEKALQDKSDEVKMMATWIMMNFGYEEKAESSLNKMFKSKPADKRLFECVKRWINDLGPNSMKTYIKSWYILGPFEDKDKKGQQAFKQALSSGEKWIPLTKGIDTEKIDLEKHFGVMDNCSAFVRTTVISSKDQQVDIKGECDDNIIGLLNNDQFIKGGKKLKGKLQLKKGKNILILKLIENGGQWWFWCQITKNRKFAEGVEFLAE
jgi:hypothetical protein